jgi:hypothetical protein
MMPRPLRFTAVLVAGIALTACWDDDDDHVAVDPPAAANEVPDSALTSSAAFTAYVGSLPASETAQPLDISKITTAPSSETALPAPI